MLRKILTILLILNLVGTSFAFAQVSPDSSTKSTFTKALDASITRQILKRMGEPGFYASRFLSLRKQINKTVCTTSEKMARIAAITSIVGDMTTHAYDYFEGKKLEKSLADKLEKIKKYEEELKKSGKKVLEFQSGNVDVQLDALKFLKSQAEIELKRAQMVSVVAYVSVGLNVTSQILAYQESAAEAASMGSLAAKNEACKSAGKPEEAKKESSTQKALNGAKEPVPWYLLPFLYMAKGIVAIEESAIYQAHRSYTRGLNKAAFIEKEKAKGNIDPDKLDQTAVSAAYTEEMIVDIVTDVIKKWKDGKRDVTEEINNFNKKSKETSGIMKFFKTIQAEEMAIRYAVRSLIQANLIQVDAFSRSGVGRAILYAHSVYIVYKTIEDNKAQVEFAKHKIEILDKTIKDFESRVTWTPVFNDFLDSILPSAIASVPSVINSPKPPCISEITPECNLKSYKLFSSDIKPYFDTLPKDIQVDQHKLLSNNYSLKAALNLATGKVQYEDISVDKLQAELKTLESISKKMEGELLSKNRDFASNFKPQLEKMNGALFFPEELVASYNKNQPESVFDSSSLGGFGASEEKAAEETKSFSAGEVISKEEIALEARPSKRVSANDYDYDAVETISKKESNLFEIITNRYIQIYKRNDLVE